MGARTVVGKFIGLALLLAAAPQLTGCVLPIASACADTLRDAYPSIPDSGLVYSNPNDFMLGTSGGDTNKQNSLVGPAAPCKP